MVYVVRTLVQSAPLVLNGRNFCDYGLKVIYDLTVHIRFTHTNTFY